MHEWETYKHEEEVIRQNRPIFFRMAKVIKEGSTIIINASQKHTGTIILTHGLGDTAAGWKDAAMEMSQKLPYIKWILPTAPKNPVTLNGGMRMPSWYDIESLTAARIHQACKGLEDSQETIMSLIRKENSEGIENSRIILAGFSQGGALSLWTGLQFPKDDDLHKSRLAGVVVLSGYMPKGHAFVLTEFGKQTPVLHCHGKADNVVHPTFAEESKKHVLDGGHTVGYDLRMYPGLAHSAHMQELSDVSAWIARVLPNV